MDQIKLLSRPGLTKLLGIKFTSLKKDSVEAELLITKDHLQPFGLMHGGVSLALAETVASVAAVLNYESDERGPVGIELSARHLKAVKEGEAIRAVASPEKIGERIQSWQVRIYSGQDLVTSASLLILNPD
jgi:uncharacterized protein (TIGR00369 family)